MVIEIDFLFQTKNIYRFLFVVFIKKDGILDYNLRKSHFNVFFTLNQNTLNIENKNLIVFDEKTNK